MDLSKANMHVANFKTQVRCIWFVSVSLKMETLLFDFMLA